MTNRIPRRILIVHQRLSRGYPTVPGNGGGLQSEQLAGKNANGRSDGWCEQTGGAQTARAGDVCKLGILRGRLIITLSAPHHNALSRGYVRCTRERERSRREEQRGRGNRRERERENESTRAAMCSGLTKPDGVLAGQARRTRKRTQASPKKEKTRREEKEGGKEGKPPEPQGMHFFDSAQEAKLWYAKPSQKHPAKLLQLQTKVCATKPSKKKSLTKSEL